jgi:hypothetical protein
MTLIFLDAILRTAVPRNYQLRLGVPSFLTDPIDRPTAFRPDAFRKANHYKPLNN